MDDNQATPAIQSIDQYDPNTYPLDGSLHVTPFTILVDSREKAPYFFRGLRTNKSDKPSDAPILVQSRYELLATGDYTISGLEDRIAIERKSLADLYSTLGQHRDRFEREHERLSVIASHSAGGFACVLIEADLHTALAHPPERSRLKPKSVTGTWMAWSQRYRVPWLFVGSRRLTEIVCFRMLERFWKDRLEKREIEQAEDHPLENIEGLLGDSDIREALTGRTLEKLFKDLANAKS